MNGSFSKLRKKINAPPTHLQEDEGTDEHPKGKTAALLRQLTVVDVDEIGEPGDGCPRLLWIPRPVVTPRLLGPKCSEKHANGEEGEAYIDEIIG